VVTAGSRLGNGLFTVIIFHFALVDPQRSGMLPILVYTIDFPASFIAEWAGSVLHEFFRTSVTGQFWIYGGVYSWLALLVLSDGMFIRWIVLRFVPDANEQGQSAPRETGTLFENELPTPTIARVVPTKLFKRWTASRF